MQLRGYNKSGSEVLRIHPRSVRDAMAAVAYEMDRYGNPEQIVRFVLSEGGQFVCGINVP